MTGPEIGDADLDLEAEFDKPADRSAKDFETSAPALWVVDTDLPSILRISLETNDIVQELEGRDVAADFAVGAGWLWTLSIRRREVTRIDPDTGEAVRLLRTEDEAIRYLAVGAGSVWVAGSVVDGKVIKADPETGDVSSVTETGNRVEFLAAGEGGAWAAQPSARAVVRLDPESGEVAATVPIPHSITGLAVGEGGVWVLGNDDASTPVLSRIAPDTNAVSATVPVTSARGFVAAGSGAVWVTDQAQSLINKVDPGAPENRTDLRTVLRPQQIAAGAGAVWVVTRFGLSMVRIDPGSGEIIAAVNPDAALDFPVIGA